MHNKHLPGAWHIFSQTQQTNIVWGNMWQEWDPRVLVGTSQSRECSHLGSIPHCDPSPPRLVSTPLSFLPPPVLLPCLFCLAPLISLNETLKWPRTQSFGVSSSTCLLGHLNQSHRFKPHLHTTGSLWTISSWDLDPELSDVLTSSWAVTLCPAFHILFPAFLFLLGTWQYLTLHMYIFCFSYL